MKIVLVLLIVLFSQSLFSQDKPSGDSLIIGNKYIFGTKAKIQYEGVLAKVDTSFLVLKTSDGNIKIKYSDITLYKLKKDPELTEIITDHDTLQYVTVEMKDNNEISGYIISRDSITLILKTGSGVIMNIPVNQILSVKKSETEFVDGTYYIKDPNESRLFVLPTARSLKRNSGYLSVTELFFPIAAFGIANYVSIAGGISLIPFSNTQLIYVNAKVTPVQTKNADVAAGYMYMNVTSKNAEGISIPYAVGTFGTKNASLTTGLGVGFSKSNSSNPILLLGGEVRAANKIKFITENWIFTEKNNNYNFSFVGVRFFGAKLAADFALIYIWGIKSNSSMPLIPYVSFTYNLDLE